MNREAVLGPLRQQPNIERPVVAVSLGCHMKGAALPKANPDEQRNVRTGLVKRLATEMPEVEDLSDFSKFVGRFIEKHFVPVRDDELNFEEWLSSRSYPLARKEQLRAAKDRMEQNGILHTVNGKQKYFKNKSFMKDEPYTEYKFPRAINSRSDEFKTFCGPFFSAVERQVFALKYFIKKIPVDLRPDYIMEHVFREGARYVATDYTSFEAGFVRRLEEACEFQLYRYMARGSSFEKWVDLLCRVMGGTNHCEFKRFWMDIEATRMSGEMCTSLGNGFTNLMIMLYVLDRMGDPDPSGVIEGDDGLFAIMARVPVSGDFNRFGMKVKMEIHDRIETASFCGLIFDVEDRANVADPLEALASFGWARGLYARSSNRTLRKLLRAKALSLAYQYPGCPIISELAAAGLRWTSDIQDKHAIYKIMKTQNQYEITTWLEMRDRPMPSRPVGMRTRILVEEKFGISVADQRAMEEALRCSSHAPLDVPFAVPPSWTHYFATYSRPSSGSYTVNVPSVEWWVGDGIFKGTDQDPSVNNATTR